MQQKATMAVETITLALSSRIFLKISFEYREPPFDEVFLRLLFRLPAVSPFISTDAGLLRIPEQAMMLATAHTRIMTALIITVGAIMMTVDA